MVAQPSHRDQLVEGAVRCLKTKGYSRTTARDIVAASGANLASIGYHFGSKEALLNEALIRILQDRNRSVGRRTSAALDGSPSNPMAALFVAAAGVLKAPRPLFVAFVEAVVEAERSPELRDQLVGLYQDTRRGLEASIRASAAQRGDPLQGDPDAMATVLLALFDGLVLQWLIEGRAPSGEGLMSALADLSALLPASTPSTRQEKTDVRTRPNPRRTKSRKQQAARG